MVIELDALIAKASPLPWLTHALTLNSPGKWLARFRGDNYALGKANVELAKLAVNHLRPLVAALDITESAMDQLNGDTGTKSRPCSFCRVEVYNAEVGIEHSPPRPELGDGGCPIIVIREALAALQRDIAKLGER